MQYDRGGLKRLRESRTWARYVILRLCFSQVRVLSVYFFSVHLLWRMGRGRVNTSTDVCIPKKYRHFRPGPGSPRLFERVTLTKWSLV